MQLPRSSFEVHIRHVYHVRLTLILICIDAVNHFIAKQPNDCAHLRDTGCFYCCLFKIYQLIKYLQVADAKHRMIIKARTRRHIKIW